MKAKHLGKFGGFCGLSLFVTGAQHSEGAIIMTDYAPIGGSATAVGTGITIPSSATAVRPSNIGAITLAGNSTAAGVSQVGGGSVQTQSSPQNVQSGNATSQQTAATTSTGGSSGESGGATSGGSGRPSSGGNRRSSGGSSASPSSTSGVSAKSSFDSKNPLPEIVVEPESFWKLNANVGWQSEYYFRGLNVLDRISPTESDDGVVSGKIDFGYVFRDGSEIDFGIGYVESVDQLLPRGAAKNLPPNPGATRFNEDFFVPSLERYTETNLLSSYKRTLIPDQLNAQIGVNYYKFSDGRFWEPEGKGGPVPDTTEIMAGLSYVGMAQYVIPTFTYVKDVDAFDGSFFSLRTDFPSFTLLQNAGFGGVTLSPFAAVSYDYGYNAPGDGWNNVDLGVNASIPIGNSGVALNLTGNYVFDLSDGVRSDEGFWGGVSISAYLDSRSFANDHLAMDPKSVVFAAPENDQKWRLSVGAGLKGVSADFGSAHVDPYDALSLIHKKKGAGDLGFANGRDAHYKDGSVFGAPPTRYDDGTADFRITSNDQILGKQNFDANGELIGGDRQLVFSSDRYSYDSTERTLNTGSSDHDDVIYPYVRLMRELDLPPLANLPFAIEAGFEYSFSRSEFDTGTRLAAVSSAYETAEMYNFIYDVDELFTLDAFSGPIDTNAARDFIADVIVDPATFAAFYGEGFSGSSPQRADSATRTEIAKVALFAHSDLQVDSHEFAIPIGIRLDLNERVHVGLEVAPTLTLFDSNLNTTIYAQQLDNLSGGRVIRNNTSFQRRTTTLSGEEFQQGTMGQNAGSASGAAGAVAPMAAQQVAGGQALSGGRAGGRILAPVLPGRTIDTYQVSHDQQDWQWGVATQASILIDLDSEDTWFLEMWARYNWVDDFSVSNGLVSATVDPSSFSGGIGLGYRF